MIPESNPMKIMSPSKTLKQLKMQDRKKDTMQVLQLVYLK